MEKIGVIKVCDITSGTTGWYVANAIADIRKEVDFFQVDKAGEADIIITDDTDASSFLPGKIYLYCNEGLGLNQLAPEEDSHRFKSGETLVEFIGRMNKTRQQEATGP